MTVNMLPVHITTLLRIEDQICTALTGRKTYNVPSLLAVINCQENKALNLESFMFAAFDKIIQDLLLETEGSGELGIGGVCQPADADGVRGAYWSDDITGSRPQQVFVVLFGNDRQVSPYFMRLRQLIQCRSFDRHPGAGDG